MGDLVSAIITTHNREWHLIRKAVLSAYNQTYKNIEIIVVNDSPLYEGVGLIKKEINKLGSRVKYIENTKCPGACGSRNVGINEAKGRIIALLDDDDEWHLDKIELMLPFFEHNIGLVYCNYAIIDSNNNVSYKNVKKYEGKVFNQLLEENFIGGCSFPIIKKECFTKVGLFDQEFKSAQDLDMWLRISKQYEVSYVDKVLVDYFVTDISITSSISNKIDGIKLLLKKYESDYCKNIKARNVWKNKVFKSYFECGKIKTGFKEYNLYYKGKDRIINSICIIKGILKYIVYRWLKKK